MFFLYENRDYWISKFKKENGFNINDLSNEQCPICGKVKNFNLPFMTYEFVGLTEEIPCCVEKAKAFYMMPRNLRKGGLT